MILKIDRKADALYLSLSENKASSSDEVSPGVIVDYDDKGRVIGIEILHISKQTSDDNLRKLLFESAAEAY